MNVAAILKEKGGDIITATPKTSLYEITKILSKHRIGCIVVCSVDGLIAGIVSERDVVRRIADVGMEALDQPVSQCMTRKVVTCSESDTMGYIMTEMTDGRFRHLPVVNKKKLIGLISIGDVVKCRIAEAEMEAAAIRDYIVTG